MRGKFVRTDVKHLRTQRKCYPFTSMNCEVFKRRTRRWRPTSTPQIRTRRSGIAVPFLSPANDDLDTCIALA